MLCENLTEDNFMLFAMRYYDNTACQTMNEFKDDLNKIKYIKRWLNRYIKTGNIKEHVTLNHLIVFYNVFETHAATKMLFFKMNEEVYPALKTFLTFLNFMPERIEGINKRIILDSDIPVDNRIANFLRSL